jgi:hypothetical protein
VAVPKIGGHRTPTFGYPRNPAVSPPMIPRRRRAFDRPADDQHFGRSGAGDAIQLTMLSSAGFSHHDGAVRQIAQVKGVKRWPYSSMTSLVISTKCLKGPAAALRRWRSQSGGRADAHVADHPGQYACRAGVLNLHREKSRSVRRNL